jgi:DNA polymerase-3 subunit delta
LIRWWPLPIAGVVPELSPEQAVAEAEGGRLRPVYVVSGEERLFRQNVVAAMRKAVVGAEGDAPGLNEDHFVAGEVEARVVLAAARTLPMFGPRRLVIVRGVERWEVKEDAKKAGASGRGVVVKPLDLLADYAQRPSESTTLLIVSDKLDNRRRLMSLARKEGFLVACNTPSRHELPDWVRRRAVEHGHEISRSAADLLAELAGTDLCALGDALERVELFVGPGKPLSEEAIARCVANLQAASVWDLATWDGGFTWGGDLQIKRDWQTAFGLGYCISAHMKGTIRNCSMHWAATDYLLQGGGVI